MLEKRSQLENAQKEFRWKSTRSINVFLPATFITRWIINKQELEEFKETEEPKNRIATSERDYQKLVVIISIHKYEKKLS